MEPSALPSNSRVTGENFIPPVVSSLIQSVECSDPSGLFSTFEPLLSHYLPLRNLHWKSPGRPLRAISSLEVSLEQAKYGQKSSATTARRHQIPGLRQTPYLKLYLLRCDDKETYKTVCRKQIREWIKSSATSADSKSSSGAQESHDAFHWLIVHVVLPNTPAAGEPRTSKHASTLGPADSTDSVNSNSKSKWPGKSSSTIYEKLRADFDSSSKTSLDRVAQIRVSDGGPWQSGRAANGVDTEDQWQDLVEKLKISILASFDLRVRQYEEDIRERDSQRSLPGWNFCTFFILKEGLARGFESVGLWEDALVGYDELSVGLDAIVREQALQSDEDQSSTFLVFGKDLKSKIRLVLQEQQGSMSNGLTAEGSSNVNETSLLADNTLRPLDQDQKPYRKMILSNDISVFDLRVYIFSCQVQLLLRGAALSLNPGAGGLHGYRGASTPQPSENLLYRAEICRRAVEFMNLAARTLRQELYSAWGGYEGQDLDDMRFQESVINNFVRSWIYCAALQVLQQTTTTALQVPDSDPGKRDRIPQPSQPGRVDGKPAKTEEVDEKPNPGDGISSPELFSPDLYTNEELPEDQAPLPARQQTDQSRSKRVGSDDLAAWRAELYLLARRQIEVRGQEHGWLPDLAKTDPFLVFRDPIAGQQADTKEIPVSSEVILPQSETPELTSLGLDTPLLRQAATYPHAFNHLYQDLTKQAYRYFQAAGKTNSSIQMTIDLGLLQWRAGQYQTAAEYLANVLVTSKSPSISQRIPSLLQVYLDCLERLEEWQDYVEAGLRLLSRYANDRCFEHKYLRSNSLAEVLLQKLTNAAQALGGRRTVPLVDYIHIESQTLSIAHFPGRDGFSLSLLLRSRLPCFINVTGGVTAKLKAKDNSGSLVLDLRSDGPVQIAPNNTKINLVSNTIAYGWFIMGSLQIYSGNIVLEHVFEEDGQRTRNPVSDSWKILQMDGAVLIYPSPESFSAGVKLASQIDLSRTRSLLIELDTGWNEVEECTVLLKAASAGLRLQVHAAHGSDRTGAIQVEHSEDSDGQYLSLGQLAQRSEAFLKVPFSQENPDATLLAARLKIEYRTKDGTFSLHHTLSITTILPVSVNVQDNFKEDALYSRFTISPAIHVPIRIGMCDLADTEQYRIEGGMEIPESVDVFPKQQASLLYKFTLRGSGPSTGQARVPIFLMEYYCMDEVLESNVEACFLEDVKQSPVACLARLLRDYLTASLRSQMTEQTLEVACLVQEIEMWSFEEIQWKAVLNGLSRLQRDEASRWLQEWHEKRRVISLQHTASTKRQISLPVHIPKPPLLVSVALRRHGTTVDMPTAIGQPLAYEVVISSTRRWSEDGATTNATSEISFELVASPETWLLGGRRRGDALGPQQDVRSFPVLLIPQRAGHLLLPSVEVKAWTADKVEEFCEVDYKAHGKSVLVIPNLKETTVSLDGGPSGSGSTLLRGRQRDAAG